MLQIPKFARITHAIVADCHVCNRPARIVALMMERACKCTIEQFRILSISIVNWIFVSHCSIYGHYFFWVAQQLDVRSHTLDTLCSSCCRLVAESLRLSRSNKFPIGVYYIVRHRVALLRNVISHLRDTWMRMLTLGLVCVWSCCCLYDAPSSICHSNAISQRHKYDFTLVSPT